VGISPVTLLDTHVVVWAAIEPARLSRTAVSALRRGRSGAGLAVASITVWEIASMFASGRIRSFGTVEGAVRQVLETIATRIIPLSLEIVVLGTQFPEDYSRDPADRIIGATARAEGMALITQDEKIRRSPLLKTIW
jgi:PIN domain nuclease of toxin-antitoxin system